MSTESTSAGHEGIAPPGTVIESASMQGASPLRQQPYRLLFPLGVLLSWAGVAHWLAYATGMLADYRPVFHATVQTQGFLTCLAAGFLFTMIPRRTGTAPPSHLEISIGALGPVLVAIASWNSWRSVAQAIWLLVALTMVSFVVRRFVAAEARRQPPNGFVWIPFAFVLGVVGAAMQILAPWSGQAVPWTQIGAGLVRQGMFIALVLGVGSLALPLMTRGQAPPDGTATRGDRFARLAHLCGGMLLVVSFWVEAAVSLQLAMTLRGSVVLVALVAGPQIWRPPRRPGWNARFILAGAWLLPVGYFVAAAWPAHFRAGLHVSLIGGLAMLALAISAQVILGHGGYRAILLGRSSRLGLMALLMAGAIVARVVMEFDRARTFAWMGLAATLFLAATVAWGWAVAPGLARPRAEPD